MFNSKEICQLRLLHEQDIFHLHVQHKLLKCQVLHRITGMYINEIVSMEDQNMLPNYISLVIWDSVRTEIYMLHFYSVFDAFTYTPNSKCNYKKQEHKMYFFCASVYVWK